MIKKEIKLKRFKNALVFIPCNVSWNWSTDYINQTAIELAKKNNVVFCYLHADIATWPDAIKNLKDFFLLKEYKRNIYLYKPVHFIPLRRFKLVNHLNYLINIYLSKLICWFLKLNFKLKKNVFWIFDPNMVTFFDSFKKNSFLVYDCLDFFAVGDKEFISTTNKNEENLSKIADLVVANSKVLLNHVKKYRKEVFLVPQGFRSREFKIDKNKMIDLKLKYPVIGFIGGINNRLDVRIISPLVKNNPNWNFVLWGPIQKDINTGSDRLSKINAILKSPNVTWGESKDKAEIPGIISQFDIGVIPYDISQDFNKYCYPMKLFEFFHLGKPVVSTAIEELKRFSDLVSIANTTNEWQAVLSRYIKNKLQPSHVKKMKRLAELNSWENKIKAIEDCL